jgi:hypothetical protein
VQRDAVERRPVAAGDELQEGASEAAAVTFARAETPLAAVSRTI